MESKPIFVSQFVKYSDVIDASLTSQSAQSKNRSNDDLSSLYPLFQSNTLLIFFGISFLYFFMKKVRFNYIVSVCLSLARLETKRKCTLATILNISRTNFKDLILSMDLRRRVTISSSALLGLRSLFCFRGFSDRWSSRKHFLVLPSLQKRVSVMI